MVSPLAWCVSALRKLSHQAAQDSDSSPLPVSILGVVIVSYTAPANHYFIAFGYSSRSRLGNHPLQTSLFPQMGDCW